MKTSSQHQRLSSGLLWLFAVGSGLNVANVYYAQPLLDVLAQSLSAMPLSAVLSLRHNSVVPWHCYYCFL